MALRTFTEFPKDSFTAAVPANLIGKEGWPVEILATTASATTIQILNAGIYIGVLRERLEGSVAWLVDTRGPIRKGVAAQAMALGGAGTPIYVKQSATGLVPANSADKACGLLLTAASAAGSICSFMAFDCIMP
jgi:hypothetical protein